MCCMGGAEKIHDALCFKYNPAAVGTQYNSTEAWAVVLAKDLDLKECLAETKWEETSMACKLAAIYDYLSDWEHDFESLVPLRVGPKP